MFAQFTNHFPVCVVSYHVLSGRFGIFHAEILHSPEDLCFIHLGAEFLPEERFDEGPEALEVRVDVPAKL